MTLRQLRSRTDRCLGMAQRNEDDIDMIVNRVEELELCNGIAEKKLYDQGQQICELTRTVKYLKTVLATITSGAFQITEREGGIIIFTKTGQQQDRGVFFPHVEDEKAARRQGVISEQVTPTRRNGRNSDVTVTPTRASKRTREQIDTPDIDAFATESVTPIPEREDRDDGKRGRLDDCNFFKLTFNETETQPPHSLPQ